MDGRRDVNQTPYFAVTAIWPAAYDHQWRCWSPGPPR
jgi:hypothetical protein